MANVHIVNIDDKIVTFCQSESFKSYVQKAVSDQMFMSNLLTKLDLNQTIDTNMGNKFSKIKSDLKNTLSEMLQKKLQEYIYQQFPSQITNELTKQIPQFLEENYQMQQILENHKKTLEAELDKNAREILDKIVNEPSYQEITRVHLTAIDRSGRDKIEEISRNADNQMIRNQKKFEQELSNMKNMVNNDLNNLKTALSNMSELQCEVERIDKKNTEQDWIIYPGFIITLVLVFLSILSTSRCNLKTALSNVSELQREIERIDKKNTEQDWIIYFGFIITLVLVFGSFVTFSLKMR